MTLVKADVEKRQIDFVLGEVDNLMRIQEMMKNSEGYVGSREKKPFGRSGISKQSKRKGKRRKDHKGSKKKVKKRKR